MTSDTMTWQQYISSLAADTQQRAQVLREEVVQICADALSQLAPFVFLPDQQHPIHEDASRVFSEAFTQMLLRKPLTSGEAPLLFVGYHIATRFTGSRFAQGFLLTDQAIYVQDDFSVLSEAPLARALALPLHAQDTQAFVVSLGKQYQQWGDWAKLAEQDASSLQQQVLTLMQSAIEKVLAYHQQHQSQQRIAPRNIDLGQFVREHSLGDSVLAGNEPGNAKKLGKVKAKFLIPEGEAVHLALADFPFFGGPYGLAMTTNALYTKDLMEDPLRISLTEVDERTLEYSEDGKEMRIHGGTPLFFPNHIKTSVRSELLDLLKQQIRQLKS